MKCFTTTCRTFSQRKSRQLLAVEIDKKRRGCCIDTTSQEVPELSAKVITTIFLLLPSFFSFFLSPLCLFFYSLPLSSPSNPLYFTQRSWDRGATSLNRRDVVSELRRSRNRTASSLNRRDFKIALILYRRAMSLIRRDART